MPFYVYILLCMDGSFYTGYTKNLEWRTKLHGNGKGARYTRTHKPKRVAYVELFDSRTKAMKRERAIKKLSHHQKLNLINTRNKNECCNQCVFEYKIDQKLCSFQSGEFIPKKKTTCVEKLNDSKGLPKVEKITDKLSKRWAQAP